MFIFKICIYGSSNICSKSDCRNLSVTETLCIFLNFEKVRSWKNQMSDANRTELKGIAALTNSLLRSLFIKPDLHANDKTESWDGFVYLYRDESWGVEPLVGRIPVQVKSTKRPFTGDKA